jgi:hypothetical protein
MTMRALRYCVHMGLLGIVGLLIMGVAAYRAASQRPAHAA